MTTKLDSRLRGNDDLKNLDSRLRGNDDLKNLDSRLRGNDILLHHSRNYPIFNRNMGINTPKSLT